MPSVQALPDAFDQPLGLVAVQRDELGGPTRAGARVERPRLLPVEFGRAQHVVLDDADESAADRQGAGRQDQLRTLTDRTLRWFAVARAHGDIPVCRRSGHFFRAKICPPIDPVVGRPQPNEPVRRRRKHKPPSNKLFEKKTLAYTEGSK